MPDPWQLIRSGQYEAAIAEYTRQYQERGGKPNLNNRGIAYLLMGNYTAALADFRQSIQSDPRHAASSEYAKAGVCSWYLDRPHDAVATWREGLDAPYTDAAGGVELPALLLYAGARLRDATLENEAISLLKKHWRKHLRQVQRSAAPTHDDLVHPGLIAWPGAIVPFLLEEIGPVDLMNAASRAGNEILRERWACQADFYIALRSLRKNDVALFRAHMTQSSASERGHLEPAWYLARWEVQRAFPTLTRSDAG